LASAVRLFLEGKSLAAECFRCTAIGEPLQFPVPVRGTLCGEPVASSVTTRLAVALPVAVGLKTMERVQLAPAAREGSQVLDRNENSLALAPENVKELTDMGIVALVLVTVSTWLAEVMPVLVVGKVRLVGEKTMVGGGTPVPLREKNCGEPMASSVTTRLAVALPTFVGLKAMERVQLAPAAREVPQVLEGIENSPALFPMNL
jgi:hypothetical protein